MGGVVIPLHCGEASPCRAASLPAPHALIPPPAPAPAPPPPPSPGSVDNYPYITCAEVPIARRAATHRRSLEAPTTAPAIVSIDLHGLGITAPLPPSLADMPALRSVNFADNDFFGTLPTLYSSLSNLEILKLDDNLISGTIPSAYSALSKMQILTMPLNVLVGYLPSSLAELRNLQTIDFSTNAGIVGPIPDAWAAPGAMDALLNANLAFNQLSGTVPAFSSLNNPAGLMDVTGNENMCGDIPPWASPNGAGTLLFDGTNVGGPCPQPPPPAPPSPERSKSRSWLDVANEYNITVSDIFTANPNLNKSVSIADYNGTKVLIPQPCPGDSDYSQFSTLAVCTKVVTVLPGETCVMVAGRVPINV